MPVRFDAPIPTTEQQPFWLARPDHEDEARIIFSSGKPHDVGVHNSFSARDVLRAADGTTPLWLLSEEETLKQALALGVDHQDAISGLKGIIQQRKYAVIANHLAQNIS